VCEGHTGTPSWSRCRAVLKSSQAFLAPVVDSVKEAADAP